jgi:3-oxoacyl-[acyl-carrier-protein] synthase III
MTICQKLLTPMTRFKKEQVFKKEDTHYKRRRYNDSMGVKLPKLLLSVQAAKEDIDFVVFATLSPDYYFPGPGVLVQRDLGLRTVGALDVRNQCSIYLCLVCCGSIY